MPLLRRLADHLLSKFYSECMLRLKPRQFTHVEDGCRSRQRRYSWQGTDELRVAGNTCSLAWQRDFTQDSDDPLMAVALSEHIGSHHRHRSSSVPGSLCMIDQDHQVTWRLMGFEEHVRLRIYCVEVTVHTRKGLLVCLRSSSDNHGSAG